VHVRQDPQPQTYSLSEYPESLQKKVTLLNHFRNYLVEQHNKVENLASSRHSGIDGPNLPYLRKWVRTKHAILFRLSNETIQVVFYDHTELLLSRSVEFVTYVDKGRKRCTYHLNATVVNHSPEIAKRLKYAKEILYQLLFGTKS